MIGQMHNSEKFRDALNRVVEITYPPQRIISLVPSITELLFDLGLEKRIIGVTNFCVHPIEKTKTMTHIGGTKDFDITKILALKPDLVIANKEENPKNEILKLAEKVPVFVTHVTGLSSALQMIEQISQITNKTKEGLWIIEEIKAQFQKLKRPVELRKAIYLIWRKPYMTINGNTFIHDMMLRAGFQNVFSQKTESYPVITAEEIKNSEAEIILLCSEPYRFKEKYIPEFLDLLPSADVRVVDGEMFTWYGSRMRLAADYFESLSK